MEKKKFAVAIRLPKPIMYGVYAANSSAAIKKAVKLFRENGEIEVIVAKKDK